MGPKQRCLQGLLKELRGARRLLILTHDNPDPDAIAAGWVLADLVRRTLRLPSTLAYGLPGRSMPRQARDRVTEAADEAEQGSLS